MSMSIKTQQGSITDIQCDAVIVNLFEGVEDPGGATGAVDKALGGAIADAVAHNEFEGKINTTLVLPTYGRLPARRVIVAGLGKQKDFDLRKARLVAAVAARQARKTGAKTVASIVHGAGIAGLPAEDAAHALAEGTAMGLYRFDKYKTKKGPDKGPVPAEFVVVERDADKLPAIQKGLEKGEIYAEGANVARDLANEPPSRMTPSTLAGKAREMAEGTSLEAEALIGQELEEKGLHAVLAVARGSAEPAALITLSYRGRSGGDADGGYDLALVGKGVTFDSGGLSLKPPAGMEDMKHDMAGAAAVVGAMHIIARVKPAINIIAVIPSVENLPGGKAMKPGDIIDTFSGKTIEVLNTDAEGRLILADGVAYARHLGARAIVDVATLTGAAMIALGPASSGLISTAEDLADQVLAAAEEAGERLWPLPSWDEYRPLYKSRNADLSNVGGRAGGAITGGLIVGEFAEDTPWAHIDIAPTAWDSKTKAYAEPGATGVMTRTLARLAEKAAEDLS